MRRLVLLSILTLLLVARLATAGSAASLFADASLIPGDIDAYVHVSDGHTLRDSRMGQPLANAVRLVFADGDLGQLWTTLAQRVGVDGAGLFDDLLGQRTTLIMRGSAWVVVTDIPRAELRALVDALRLARMVPRSGFEIGFDAQQGLLVASGGKSDDGVRCVIGAAAQRVLFDEVIDRMAGEREGGVALAETTAIRRARSLPDGEVGIYVRHDMPMGGWSVMTASRGAGDVLELAHHARFDAPPFDRPPTSSAWNPAPLESFAKSAIVAFMEPVDIGVGATGAFLERSLGAPLIDRQLQQRMGEHRILTMGEVDGRSEQAADALIPAFAVAFPLRDDATMRRDFDVHMARLLRAMGETAPDPLLLLPPAGLAPDAPRHVDLGPLAAQVLDGAGTGTSISLDWVVVEGPGSHYGVIASHPVHLEDTVRALQTARARHGEGANAADGVGTFTSVGLLDGPRLARHLRSWRTHADWLTVDPQGAAQLRESIDLLAALSEGMTDCRWRLRRPCANSMDLRVQVRPAAPTSGD